MSRSNLLTAPRRGKRYTQRWLRSENLICQICSSSLPDESTVKLSQTTKCDDGMGRIPWMWGSDVHLSHDGVLFKTLWIRCFCPWWMTMLTSFFTEPSMPSWTTNELMMLIAYRLLGLLVYNKAPFWLFALPPMTIVVVTSGGVSGWHSRLPLCTHKGRLWLYRSFIWWWVAGYCYVSTTNCYLCYCLVLNVIVKSMRNENNNISLELLIVVVFPATMLCTGHANLFDRKNMS